MLFPNRKFACTSAIDRWDLGEASIFHGEVTISIDGMTISFDAGVVSKTKDGWAVISGYAKLLPKKTFI
jgi:hypothetical protein